MFPFEFSHDTTTWHLGVSVPAPPGVLMDGYLEHSYLSKWISSEFGLPKSCPLTVLVLLLCRGSFRIALRGSEA